MTPSPVLSDLDQALASSASLWEGLRGARVFLTGGTGFFGSWLLETLVAADHKLNLGCRVVVLTRDEAFFRAKRPHLARAKAVSFHSGDVRTFDFPPGAFTHAVHAAAEADDKMIRERPDFMRDVIVGGTRRVLDFASAAGVNKFLFVSSGAVYGRQRPETTHVAEDDPSFKGSIDGPMGYAGGKREAEALCLDAKGIDAKIARGFAFVGPYLPLDAHFAIGNFIRDALRGGPIEIRGDGTPYRSYLYASDLAVWLWTILLKGKEKRAYNVGSERRVSVAELAKMVAAVVAPGTAVNFARQPRPGQPVEQYVPSTERARTELGLQETVPLEEGIRRTAAWAAQAKVPS